MAYRHVDLVTSAKIRGLQWFENGIVVYIHLTSLLRKLKSACTAYLSSNALVLVPVSLSKFSALIFARSWSTYVLFSYDGLPVEPECVQKQAMPIIVPLRSYNEAKVKSGLTKLSDRRQELVDKLFKEVLQNEPNKLVFQSRSLPDFGTFHSWKARTDCSSFLCSFSWNRNVLWCLLGTKWSFIAKRDRKSVV